MFDTLGPSFFTSVPPSGKYPPGCSAFNHISPDVERDERDIKEDKETAKEETYDEVCGCGCGSGVWV